MRTGEIIDGKYVVERVLGEGGMGIVVAARHFVYGTPVALKLLRTCGDDIQMRRFLREVRGASQLHGDHVARVFDYGQLADGRPYMAMELLDGPDLASMLDVAPLPAKLAATYVIQACLGLAEAHARGIVHRDIKPANLMLSRGAIGEPIVKVVDFGIATASCEDTDDEITAAHTVIGSITYMSPEQLRSAHDLDARSDVWSLGVTLYELISGRVPFDGDTFAGVAVSIATEAHTPLVEAAPELAAIVDRCLAKNPDDRYASVLELADALAVYANMPRISHAAATVRIEVPHTTSRLLAGEAMFMPAVRQPRRIGWLAAAAAALVVLVGVSVRAANPGDALAASAAPVAQPVVAQPAVTVTPVTVTPVTVTPIEVPREPTIAKVNVEEPAATPVVEVARPLVHAKPVAFKRAAKPVKRTVAPRGKRVAKQASPAHCDPRDPRCLL